MGVILFEASGSSGAFTTNYIMTHTHKSYGGTNTVVIGAGFSQISPSYLGAPGSVTHTMTYGGVTMTSLGIQALNNAPSGHGWVELFYLFNPPSGSQTVTTTYGTTGSTDNYLGAVTCSYQNVASLGSLVYAYGPGPDQAITVTGGGTDSVAILILGNDQYFSPMPGTRKDNGFNGSPLAIADSILNGSNVFTATQGTATRYWAALGVALNPIPSTAMFTILG